MAHHMFFSFKVLLHIGFNFILATILAESVPSAESNYESCKPKNCGSGPDISYPFYITRNGTDCCGHPGFRVGCEDHKPIYRTSGADYVILNINYKEQSFRLVDIEVLNNTTCPTPQQNYSFDRSSLDFSPYHASIIFFYNCSSSISTNYTESGIPCDASVINKIYIALVPRDEHFNWNRTACEFIVAAPIELGQLEINQTIRNIDYKKKLSDGFTLKWIGLEYNCAGCQTSGGRCGFEEENSVCYCPDGTHPKHCNDDGRCISFSILFLCLFGLHYSEQERKPHPSCPAFTCGKSGELKFPFTNTTLPAPCGLLVVDGCDKDTQKIQLERKGRWYEVTNISQANEIFIQDEVFSKQLHSHKCKTFKNLSLPISTYLSFLIKSNLTMFKCSHKLSDPSLLEHKGCNNSSIYYSREQQNLPSLPPHCSLLQLPLYEDGNYSDIFSLLTANFSVEVQVSGKCWSCHYRGGECQVNSKANFYCANVNGGNDKLRLKLGLGLGVGIGVSVIILLFLFIFQRRYIRRQGSSNFLSTNSYSDPSSKSEMEVGGAYFGVPVFPYNELEKATSNFDSQKELGDGGFGAVYYGKLRDGREVAVKRLYEHNYRRVEQFMNEVEILTRLRHKNLVSLYGCTSRHSRELLLVYEYVPNGTVADHLHGDRANSSPLSWPIRMSISIETATALAYLHASDTIHRDVKTNNILLDSNFCVKVADFGLSRLFPNDVTHVSTAPQGTPGYVDPEYHQCYQLTDKSDVYSFGVVLIELISSMPAVDICRHRHEINLANLAINKIQNCAFDDLIDPSLGYESDEEVKRMTISVAELAFRCLQQDKEMRPSMEEVLEELKRIESGEDKDQEEVQVDIKESRNMLPPPSPPDCDEAGLLKNIRLPPSPDTVTAKWDSIHSSCSTTRSICS